MKVQDVISACSTGQVAGLSQQLLKRLLVKNLLVRINHPLIVCEGSQNNPYLQPLAYQFLVQAVESRDRKLVINSCLRTIMQQYMLHAQHINGWCGIRAAAAPGKSNHNSGLSIDVNDASCWRPALEKFNWKYLGDWDPMHFDFSPKSSSPRGKLLSLGELQIKEFQQLWNDYQVGSPLTVDGKWGAKTAAALARSPVSGFGESKVLKRGMYSADTCELQHLLRIAMGLKDLVPDSHFGAETEKAVRAFQQKYKLAVDGTVSETTLALLQQCAGGK